MRRGGKRKRIDRRTREMGSHYRALRTNGQGFPTSTRTSSGFFLLLADSIFENFLLALLAESSSNKYKSL